MRILIATLLVASMSAHADVIARTRNDAGGQIVLTDEPCHFAPKGFKAISYGNGKTLRGCWGPFKYDSSRIVVLWEDEEDTRTYPLSIFKTAADVQM